MTRVAQDIPYLEGVRLLEGNGDREFHPCRTGDPESRPNQKYQDRIELGSRYVCAEDPALQKHLRKLGIRESDYFSLKGRSY